jgi:hypothetical protein
MADMQQRLAEVVRGIIRSESSPLPGVLALITVTAAMAKALPATQREAAAQAFAQHASELGVKLH